MDIIAKNYLIRKIDDKMLLKIVLEEENENNRFAMEEIARRVYIGVKLSHSTFLNPRALPAEDITQELLMVFLSDKNKIREFSERMVNGGLIRYGKVSALRKLINDSISFNGKFMRMSDIISTNKREVTDSNNDDNESVTKNDRSIIETLEYNNVDMLIENRSMQIKILLDEIVKISSPLERLIITHHYLYGKTFIDIAQEFYEDYKHKYSKMTTFASRLINVNQSFKHNIRNNTRLRAYYNKIEW